MRLLLIRHTAPEIETGRCYGRLDIPAKPDALAAWLQTWDAAQHPHQPWQGYTRLLSSPALRCAVLTQALSARLGLVPEFDTAWQEMDFGTWEGRSWDAIGRVAVDAWAADPIHHAPGGGESAPRMMTRVARAYEAWRAQRQDAVLVCHGGTIRLLQAWHAGRPDSAAAVDVQQVADPAVQQATLRGLCPDAPAQARLMQATQQALSLAAPPVGGIELLSGE